MRYPTYLMHGKECIGTLESFLQKNYEQFPTYYRLNHDLKRDGINPVTTRQYQYELLIAKRGEATLKQYDEIHCQGIRCYVDRVYDCDIHPEHGVDCEFTDFDGQYRSWKSEIDGGKIIYLEEGAINAAEKLTQRLLYRDLRSYFRNEELFNTPYTLLEFEYDMHTGIVPLAYSTTEDGEYEIQVNLDAYDNTIFLEVPEDLQAAAGTDKYVMERYRNNSELGYEVVHSTFDQYISEAECILDDFRAMTFGEQERA